MSVLLENIPLVKFIKTTSGTRVVYFLTREFIDDVISVISFYYFIDVSLSIWILFSRGNNNILLTRCARS